MDSMEAAKEQKIIRQQRGGRKAERKRQDSVDTLQRSIGLDSMEAAKRGKEGGRSIGTVEAAERQKAGGSPA